MHTAHCTVSSVLYLDSSLLRICRVLPPSQEVSVVSRGRGVWTVQYSIVQYSMWFDSKLALFFLAVCLEKGASKGEGGL